MTRTHAPTGSAELAPNHHHDHPSFTGLYGLVGALAMTFGRDPDARLATELLGVGPDDVAVDIGCGTGAAVRASARAGATTIGVDPAPTMLRFARLRTLGTPRVRYEVGTAESIPVPDDDATVVWSMATVHHWKDLDAGLAEVRRILRPGGRFLAMERRTAEGANGLASHGWTDAQAAAFAERCTEAGFTQVTAEQHEAGRGPAHIVIATTS